MIKWLNYLSTECGAILPLIVVYGNNHPEAKHVAMVIRKPATAPNTNGKPIISSFWWSCWAGISAGEEGIKEDVPQR